MSTELHLAIAAALEAGLAVVPPREDGTKRPIGEWKQYQVERPSRDQVRTWYGQDGYVGLGLVTGAVSAGLEMLEFEGRAVGLVADLHAMADASGFGELVERISSGYTEETPSGGLHWLYRVDRPLGNTKLARRPATAEELATNSDDKVKVLIETRGEGGYVIVAPSNGRVHPTGGRWTVKVGGFETLAVVTIAERDALFDLCRTFDRMRVLDRLPSGEGRSPGPSGSDRPGDRYNQRSDIQAEVLALLLRHGWTRVYGRNGVDYLRRPGKKDPGISATLGYLAPGVLHVFSTSTVFDEGAHDPFGVYARLEHGGDFTAAAKALEPPVQILTAASSASRERPAARGDEPPLDELPRQDEGDQPDGSDSWSAERDGGTGRPTPLVFQTARELAAEVGPETRWAIFGWLAAAALCELVGKAKAAGKTTLICAMIRALLEGKPFLGAATIQTSVVLLTEQSASSLRPRLTRFGLADRDDLLILTWRAARGSPWGEVVAAAVAECARIDAQVLVVDTLPAFAGLHGDAENDAGAALSAIAPLQAAAAGGLAVVVVRHERKGGGEVGDSARGSSAFTGAVDVVLRLARELNPARPGIRILSALSRFDETPEEVVIELVDDHYILLGDQASIALAEARAGVLAAIDESGDGPTMKELEGAIDAKRTTIQEAVRGLLGAGTITRSGKGVAGSPFRHHRSWVGSAGVPPYGGTPNPADRPVPAPEPLETFPDEVGEWEP